jgi:hypothetical protein
MAWYPTMVFYFGIFDAGLIMLGACSSRAAFLLVRTTPLSLSELVQR